MACNGMASYPFFPPNFILDNEEEHQLPSHLTHILPSNQCSNLQELRGVATMMGKRSMSFSGFEPSEDMNIDDDLSDDCLQLGEKKRRLNVEQVRALEKNFEMGNKLDPDRKMQLAKALGLQPRQIAIWFQNRRARWKTKQLEKDYQQLKNQFEAVKIENDGLKGNNKKLHAEILALRGREASEQINLNKETEGSSSNRSENSSETNLDFSRTAAMESPLHHKQSIAFFPSFRSPSMVQLLHSSKPEFQCPKIEQSIPEENFSNLLCGTEDQPVFWPW